MSAIRRVFLGTAGNWAGIGLIFAQRLLITPIVLGNWSADQFGFYLALSAATTLITLPGRSYENVICRELLRIGGDDPLRLKRLFGGGVLVSLGLEACIAILVFVFLTLGPHLHSSLIAIVNGHEGSIAMAIFISRALNAFPGATFSQVLSCYGYFPKLIWLGLISRALSVIVPAVGAIAGCGPVSVTLLDLLAPSIFTLPAWILLRKWAIRSGVWGWSPDLGAAIKTLFISLQNLASEVVLMMRGEGLRVLLSSLSSSGALTAFVTTRTGANLALQGMSTVTSPIMPELMRFLRMKDQGRIESIFSVLWLPVLFIMCPAVLVLQIFVSPLFEAWTRGKVHFDPILFAILSIGVLFNAATQPASAVVNGNNLVRSQLITSTMASLLVMGGVLFTVPKMGITGAAWSLLMGEVLSSGCYVWFATKWMRDNDLAWPARSYIWILFAVFVTSGGLLSLAMCDTSHRLSHSEWLHMAIAGFPFPLIGICALRYWNRLPVIARNKFNHSWLSGRLSSEWRRKGSLK